METIDMWLSAGILIATIAYSLTAVFQAISLKRQNKISERQLELIDKQTDVAQRQMSLQQKQAWRTRSELFFAVNQALHYLWRESFLVDDLYGKGVAPVEDERIQQFIEMYRDFTEEHWVNVQLLLGPNSDTAQGMRYLDEILWASHDNDAWSGMDKFRDEHESIQDFLKSGRKAIRSQRDAESSESGLLKRQ